MARTPTEKQVLRAVVEGVGDPEQMLDANHNVEVIFSKTKTLSQGVEGTKITINLFDENDENWEKPARVYNVVVAVMMEEQFESLLPQKKVSK